MEPGRFYHYVIGIDWGDPEAFKYQPCLDMIRHETNRKKAGEAEHCRIARETFNRAFEETEMTKATTKELQEQFAEIKRSWERVLLEYVLQKETITNAVSRIDNLEKTIGEKLNRVLDEHAYVNQRICDAEKTIDERLSTIERCLESKLQNQLLVAHRGIANLEARIESVERFERRVEDCEDMVVELKEKVEDIQDSNQGVLSEHASIYKRVDALVVCFDELSKKQDVMKERDGEYEAFERTREELVERVEKLEHEAEKESIRVSGIGLRLNGICGRFEERENEKPFKLSKEALEARLKELKDTKKSLGPNCSRSIEDQIEWGERELAEYNRNEPPVVVLDFTKQECEVIRSALIEFYNIISKLSEPIRVAALDKIEKTFQMRKKELEAPAVCTIKDLNEDDWRSRSYRGLE